MVENSSAISPENVFNYFIDLVGGYNILIHQYLSDESVVSLINVLINLNP